MLESAHRIIRWGLALTPIAVFADDATIVGVYEDCRFVTSTVVVGKSELAGAAARAQLAAAGLDFDEAVGAMVGELERAGVRTISVERQGVEGCAPASSGNFVEATANYCGERLVTAAVTVDRVMFAQIQGPDVPFEQFVRDSARKLQQSGIWDTPRIVINSNECGAAQVSQ